MREIGAMLNGMWLHILLALSVCFGAPLAALAQSAMAPSAGSLRALELRCESRADAMGIDAAQPRLTWILESGRRGARQSAYRILVASSADALARGRGDLWDSGKVESSETAHISYEGQPLRSRQRCFWMVMAWDGDDRPGPWSEIAMWEMGLLDPADWQAQWIDISPDRVAVTIDRAVYYSVDGKVRRDVTARVEDLVERGEPVVATNEALGGDPAPNVLKRLTVEYRSGESVLSCDVAEGATAVLADARWPYLRQTFRIERPVARARLYATALGMYEMHLNGQPVGDEQLAPGWTDYRRRVEYRVFDVTDQLRRGSNALGAIAAPGWFAGRAGLFHIRGFYGSCPALIAQLEIIFEDGTAQRIVSDESWRRHPGALIAADLMDGAMYDARDAMDDWCSADLDQRGWSPVGVRPESRNLQCARSQPVRALMELPATSVAQPKPGRWTFDVGQNMVGVVRLLVDEPAGTVITTRHGEMLNADGTIYTANLRGAAATDTYICRGGGIETWQPAFTYHGFRYVEVTGLTHAPDANAVTGIVFGSDLPAAGAFECSSPALNQLQSNIVWGLRGNYLSVPTDCPQRDERMGWMADAQVFAPSAAYNADIAAFMDKWLVDVDDAQRADGAYADVAPVMRGLSYGTPAWADAGVLVPWTVYEMYGNAAVLRDHIDSMKRWVDWCEAHSTDLIRDRDRGNDYGDWLSIDADTPKDLIGTAYFARSADLVSRSLRVLGRDEEADGYALLFEQVREAFVARYVQADGTITGDTQTGYLLALRFDLLEPAQRRLAMQRLVENIERRDGRLSTGFLGVGLLLPVLGDDGRADVAYDVLMQDEFPSWLYCVKRGATTIWERWNGWTAEGGIHPDAGMNSFNHYALGSCGQWFYEGIGGIRVDPAHPGFAQFRIEPCVDPSLTWASATYRSIRGEIRSRWSIDGDRLTLEVTIPANTSAVVRVPAAADATIAESGQPLNAAGGVALISRESGCVVLRVGSGQYSFESIIAPVQP